MVRLAPGPREVVHQRELERPPIAVDVPGGLSGLLQSDHHLTHDVELALEGRAVADADRARVLVAGKVGELELGDPPAAVDGVDDLQVGRVPGHGAQQPAAPQLRLLGVSGIDQGPDRERRVAQPAEPVVPVAFAARVLGQGGGGGCHDPAGAGVGQQPQGEQRAADQVRVRYVGAAARGPVLVLGDGRVDAVVEHPEAAQRHV